jgi:hypothetical protein
MAEQAERTGSGADRLAAVAFGALAAYHLALGLLMAIAPDTFFSEVGPFGPQNDHYIRDTATYNLAIGAVLAVAVARHSWRLPLLALLLIQFALHTINHLVDIDEAEPDWIGVADFVALAVVTVLIAALVARTGRRAGTGNRAAG